MRSAYEVVEVLGGRAGGGVARLSSPLTGRVELRNRPASCCGHIILQWIGAVWYQAVPLWLGLAAVQR